MCTHQRIPVQVPIHTGAHSQSYAHVPIHAQCTRRYTHSTDQSVFRGLLLLRVKRMSVCVRKECVCVCVCVQWSGDGSALLGPLVAFLSGSRPGKRPPGRAGPQYPQLCLPPECLSFSAQETELGVISRDFTELLEPQGQAGSALPGVESNHVSAHWPGCFLSPKIIPVPRFIRTYTDL